MVFPGAHTEANDCLQTIVKQFVDKGSTQGVDTSCVAQIKLPPFVLSEPAPSS